MNQRQVWDKIAKPWKEFRTKISPTVEFFLKNKNGKILDDGCGSGRNFVNHENIEWYGTDFSRKMLKYAKENAEKKNMNVKLFEADSVNLPFDDNFFDSVIYAAVLHCIDSDEKRKKSIEEIYRVLKKGGEALISSWGKKSPRLKTKGKECRVPWTTRENDKTERYTYIFDLEELENLTKEVGFEIVKSWEERNVNVIVKKLR
ncbi:MAG: methyltransferase domain-containing protein [Candidatus Pacearchaeota archaeon]